MMVVYDHSQSFFVHLSLSFKIIFYFKQFLLLMVSNCFIINLIYFFHLINLFNPILLFFIYSLNVLILIFNYYYFLYSNLFIYQAV